MPRFGCFKYEFHPHYSDPKSADYLTLHIRNAYAPDSPFAHLTDMAQTLADLIKQAEAKRPDVKRAQCGSWINDVPNFTTLFPPAWNDLLRAEVRHAEVITWIDLRHVGGAPSCSCTSGVRRVGGAPRASAH